MSNLLAQNLERGGFLRLPQVLQLIPISKSSWYQGVKDGRYPPPVSITTATSAWAADEIQALIERLKAERSANQPVRVSNVDAGAGRRSNGATV